MSPFIMDACHLSNSCWVSDYSSISLEDAHDIYSLPQKFDYTHGWMRWGAVGLTAFSLATALSLRPIRHAAFEFFLISHIVLIWCVIWCTLL